MNISYINEIINDIIINFVHKLINIQDVIYHIYIFLNNIKNYTIIYH